MTDPSRFFEQAPGTHPPARTCAGHRRQNMIHRHESISRDFGGIIVEITPIVIEEEARSPLEGDISNLRSDAHRLQTIRNIRRKAGE